MPSSTLHFKSGVLTYVIAVLIVCGGFLGASEYIIRTYVSHVEPFSQSVNIFWDARNRDIKEAAFGASEIARGLNVSNERFYNLAVGGEHLGLTRAKVLAFAENRKIKRIILPATAATLNRSKPPYDSRTEFYANGSKPNLMLLMDHHRSYSLSYLRTYLIEGNFVSSVEFLDRGVQVPTAKDEVVPLAKLSSVRRRSEGQSKFLENAKFEYSSELKSPALNIYRELVEKVVSQGGEVCLLHMPYASGFREYARKSKWYSEDMPRIWNRFARSFGNNVRYINAIDMVDDYRLFRDATHLTPEGAKKYGPALYNLCFPN